MRPFAWFGEKFNSGFGKLAHGYANLAARLVRAVAVMLIVYAGIIALTAWRLESTPAGFIPPQDQGIVIMAANLPNGASLARTDAVIRKSAVTMLRTPEVIGVSAYAGVDATSQTTNSASGQPM